MPFLNLEKQGKFLYYHFFAFDKFLELKYSHKKIFFYGNECFTTDKQVVSL